MFYKPEPDFGQTDSWTALARRGGLNLSGMKWYSSGLQTLVDWVASAFEEIFEIGLNLTRRCNHGL